MQRLSLIFLIFPLLLCAACSKNQPLSGQVTFRDDGSPVTEGVVTFTDGKSEARGKIAPDGKYVVGFEKETNGIPPGQYAVYISGAGKSDGNVFISSIDVKYNEPKTSALTFTADGSTSTFDIQVDRAKPR